jgi:hypothetical protein
MWRAEAARGVSTDSAGPKLQSWCRDCFAGANARNYRRNHEREKTRLLRQVKERRAQVRQKIIEYLAGHPCVDCGETDIVVR